MSRDDYSMIPTCIFRSNQGIKTQVEGNQPLEACPIATGDAGLMLSHERGTGKSSQFLSSSKSINKRQCLFDKQNILRLNKGIVLIFLEVSLILFSCIPQQDL